MSNAKSNCNAKDARQINCSDLEMIVRKWPFNRILTDSLILASVLSSVSARKRVHAMGQPGFFLRNFR